MFRTAEWWQTGEASILATDRFRRRSGVSVHVLSHTNHANPSQYDDLLVNALYALFR